MQITWKALFTIAGIFFVMATGIVWLGYIAIFRPQVVEREIALVRTNEIIRERLVMLTNEKKIFEKEERNANEKIILAGSITNSRSLAGAISRFYALQSNQ